MASPPGNPMGNPRGYSLGDPLGRPPGGGHWGIQDGAPADAVREAMRNPSGRTGDPLGHSLEVPDPHATPVCDREGTRMWVCLALRGRGETGRVFVSASLGLEGLARCLGVELSALTTLVRCLEGALAWTSMFLPKSVQGDSTLGISKVVGHRQTATATRTTYPGVQQTQKLMDGLQKTF